MKKITSLVLSLLLFFNVSEVRALDEQSTNAEIHVETNIDTSLQNGVKKFVKKSTDALKEVPGKVQNAFLSLGTKVSHVTKKVVEAFNKLPKGAKIALLAGAGSSATGGLSYWLWKQLKNDKPTEDVKQEEKTHEKNENSVNQPEQPAKTTEQKDNTVASGKESAGDATDQAKVQKPEMNPEELIALNDTQKSNEQPEQMIEKIEQSENTTAPEGKPVGAATEQDETQKPEMNPEESTALNDTQKFDEQQEQSVEKIEQSEDTVAPKGEPAGEATEQDETQKPEMNPEEPPVLDNVQKYEEQPEQPIEKIEQSGPADVSEDELAGVATEQVEAQIPEMNPEELIALNNTQKFEEPQEQPIEKIEQSEPANAPGKEPVGVTTEQAEAQKPEMNPEEPPVLDNVQKYEEQPEQPIEKIEQSEPANAPEEKSVGVTTEPIETQSLEVESKNLTVANDFDFESKNTDSRESFSTDIGLETLQYFDDEKVFEPNTGQGNVPKNDGSYFKKASDTAKKAITKVNNAAKTGIGLAVAGGVLGIGAIIVKALKSTGIKKATDKVDGVVKKVLGRLLALFGLDGNDGGGNNHHMGGSGQQIQIPVTNEPVLRGNNTTVVVEEQNNGETQLEEQRQREKAQRQREAEQKRLREERRQREAEQRQRVEQIRTMLGITSDMNIDRRLTQAINNFAQSTEDLSAIESRIQEIYDAAEVPRNANISDNLRLSIFMAARSTEALYLNRKDNLIRRLKLEVIPEFRIQELRRMAKIPEDAELSNVLNNNITNATNDLRIFNANNRDSQRTINDFTLQYRGETLTDSYRKTLRDAIPNILGVNIEDIADDDLNQIIDAVVNEAIRENNDDVVGIFRSVLGRIRTIASITDFLKKLVKRVNDLKKAEQARIQQQREEQERLLEEQRQREEQERLLEEQRQIEEADQTIVIENANPQENNVDNAVNADQSVNPQGEEEDKKDADDNGETKLTEEEQAEEEQQVNEDSDVDNQGEEKDKKDADGNEGNDSNNNAGEEEQQVNENPDVDNQVEEEDKKDAETGNNDDADQLVVTDEPKQVEEKNKKDADDSGETKSTEEERAEEEHQEENNKKSDDDDNDGADADQTIVVENANLQENNVDSAVNADQSVVEETSVQNTILATEARAVFGNIVQQIDTLARENGLTIAEILRIVAQNDYRGSSEDINQQINGFVRENGLTVESHMDLNREFTVLAKNIDRLNSLVGTGLDRATFIGEVVKKLNARRRNLNSNNALTDETTTLDDNGNLLVRLGSVTIELPAKRTENQNLNAETQSQNQGGESLSIIDERFNIRQQSRIPSLTNNVTVTEEEQNDEPKPSEEEDTVDQPQNPSVDGTNSFTDENEEEEIAEIVVPEEEKHISNIENSVNGGTITVYEANQNDRNSDQTTNFRNIIRNMDMQTFGNNVLESLRQPRRTIFEQIIQQTNEYNRFVIPEGTLNGDNAVNHMLGVLSNNRDLDIIAGQINNNIYNFNDININFDEAYSSDATMNELFAAIDENGGWNVLFNLENYMFDSLFKFLKDELKIKKFKFYLLRYAQKKCNNNFEELLNKLRLTSIDKACLRNVLEKKVIDKSGFWF